ncbi:MAG: hypothetical protein HKN29_08450 [Rhodothermales bacterium]|nr:hypothetical protein [Rhodothermales bacterium]
MLQLLVQPMAAIAEDRSAADYTEWLLDRGVAEGHDALEQALGTAARAHHTSLESFVLDFVQILDKRGELGNALDLFGGDTKLESADELLALILQDLRSLSPKEPLATNRLSRADQAALVIASGHTASVQIISDPVSADELAPTRADTRSSFGLNTSIQALGP